MELPEHDDSSEVTDFRQHFNAEVLFSGGVNFTALLDEDLRCGGRVVATNLTYRKLNELAADCMLQKCLFRYDFTFQVELKMEKIEGSTQWRSQKLLSEGLSLQNF